MLFSGPIPLPCSRLAVRGGVATSFINSLAVRMGGGDFF